MNAVNHWPEALMPADPSASLTHRYADVRCTTQALCETLTAEDHMLQSMADCSPAKWHLAHTTWFFETFILKEALPGYRLFHPDFTYVFNSYYKQLGSHPNRANRGLFSRPPLNEVREYRSYVDEHMTKLLNSESREHVRSVVEIGLNHEQQHQELIVTDVTHGMWSQPLRPAYRPDAAQSERSAPSKLNWIPHGGGIHHIGHEGNGFNFDNETPRHQVLLQPFALASRLISNAEYLAFIEDGGYERPELWLSEGWDTVCANKWAAPLYWEQRDSRWMEFTCAGTREIDPNQPVCHVSYFEADAYARWAGARLATEFEWEVAAAQLPICGNLLENWQFHPAAAAASITEAPQQMYGDVWEWTASQYTAYPGFHTAAGALGEYNGKFMCNQFVLRGGSCATPQSHIRASYRNFFPPHARWQFTGIRLAK